MIKVGMVSTSWWADAMYLPALTNHPGCEVVAVCGRNPERAQAFADSWNIATAYTDYQTMLESEELDAVVVATGNDSHHPITMAALAKGLHVLCEKPLALDVAQAQEMADLAAEKGVKTLVPFTYRFMPTNRYIKELIETGYIGQPYHLAMRYYAGYGREPGYLWRFDKAKAGSGIIGDLGTHFLYLAMWYYGKITAVTCQTNSIVDRGDTDPDGNPYEQLEDTASMLMQFENGAQATIHVTCTAFEKTQFGQRHFSEFHGSEGTLYSEIDWIDRQIVRGAKSPDGLLEEMPLPEHIWGNARRNIVHDTYKDVFRQDLLMIGEWIDAIINDSPADPSFADGLEIQKVMAAAIQSAEEGRRIEIE